METSRHLHENETHFVKLEDCRSEESAGAAQVFRVYLGVGRGRRDKLTTLDWLTKRIGVDDHVRRCKELKEGIVSSL